MWAAGQFSYLKNCKISLPVRSFSFYLKLKSLFYCLAIGLILLSAYKPLTLNLQAHEAFSTNLCIYWCLCPCVVMLAGTQTAPLCKVEYHKVLQAAKLTAACLIGHLSSWWCFSFPGSSELSLSRSRRSWWKCWRRKHRAKSPSESICISCPINESSTFLLSCQSVHALAEATESFSVLVKCRMGFSEQVLQQPHRTQLPLGWGGSPSSIPLPCGAPPGSAAAGAVRAGLQRWQNSSSKSWAIQDAVFWVARSYFGSVADHRCARSPVGGGNFGSLLFTLEAAVATRGQPQPVGSASLAPSRAFYPRRGACRFLNASSFPQRPWWAQGRALINEHPPQPHSFIHPPARRPRPPKGGVASHSQSHTMGRGRP